MATVGTAYPGMNQWGPRREGKAPVLLSAVGHGRLGAGGEQPPTRSRRDGEAGRQRRRGFGRERLDAFKGLTRSCRPETPTRDVLR